MDQYLFWTVLAILIVILFVKNTEDFVYIRSALRKDYIPKKTGWM